MRSLLAFLLLLGVLGCTSAGDESEGHSPRPATIPQPPPTDPRVSELQVLVAELLDRIEVMNARLERLEAVGSDRVPSGRTTATAAPPGSKVAPGRSPATAPKTAAPPAAGGQRLSSAPAAIGDAYRDALTLFGKGRINDSRALFQQVFDADPSGDLADNALYWIGETYFVTGAYSEAIGYYRRVEREFPSQNKAPDAMLKMGMAQAKTGDLILARQTYERLISSYAYSTAASAARAELKHIQY